MMSAGPPILSLAERTRIAKRIADRQALRAADPRLYHPVAPIPAPVAPVYRPIEAVRVEVEISIKGVVGPQFLFVEFRSLIFVNRLFCVAFSLTAVRHCAKCALTTGNETKIRPPTLRPGEIRLFQSA